MFIKKDLRKIPEILEDPEDERTSLKLFKRANEFEGNLSILGIEMHSAALCNLRVLNLYDNHLTTVEGIGHLDQTPIEEINLGCNDLSTLPLEFGRVSSLRSLWLDDNNFEVFPICICELRNLESLRFSSNKLSMEDLPSTFAQLSRLENLALDNNLIEEVPDEFWALLNLRHLWLRQNKIAYLSSDIFNLTQLETLSLSSNRLKVLPGIGGPEDAPVSWRDMRRLSKVYLNGNLITSLPESLSKAPALEVINVANNALGTLPVEWMAFASDPSLTMGGTLVATRSQESKNERVEQGGMEVVGENAGESQEVKITILGNSDLLSALG